MIVSVEPKGEFNFLNVLIVGDDGERLRYVRVPGDDFSGDPEEVLHAQDEFHTPEIIAAYADWIARQPSLFAPSKPRRVGTPREFLELFSDVEQTAFFAAESANVELKIWWAKASTGDFSLDHPSVAKGLAGLVDAGILSQTRSEEILGSDFDDVT